MQIEGIGNLGTEVMLWNEMDKGPNPTSFL